MKIFKRTLFWSNLKDSFSVLGSLTTGGMAGADAVGIVQIDPKWMALTSAITLIGVIASAWIGIWMKDENKDGIVDLFQDDTK